MRGKPRGMIWLFLSTLLLSMAGWVAVAQNTKRINDNALKDAGKNKEEWISYNRDWSETRFSPLDQINATNVTKLGLAWSFDIPNVGAGNRQEAHASVRQRRPVQHHTLERRLCGGRAHRQGTLAVRIRKQIVARRLVAVSSTVASRCMRVR